MNPDYWRKPASDINVNPNPPVGTGELIRLVGGGEVAVLDIGCGFGKLAPHFEDYIGIDVAEHRIAEATVRYPEKTFRVCELPGDLSWAKNRETIICRDVFIHFSALTIRECLVEFAETAPKVVVCEHLNWPEDKWLHRDDGYVCNRELTTYEKWFSAVGFTLEELVPIMNPRYEKELHIMQFVQRGE